MIIDYGYDSKLEVPKELEKHFLKSMQLSKLPNEISSSELVDYEDIYELLEKHDGKITSKEIATFLSELINLDVPAEGGYNFYDCFEFQDNGYNYVIIFFGWNAGTDEGCGYKIGYKEIIKEEKE